MANMPFVDASKYQGIINYAKYPYRRITLRAGYGNQGVDECFAPNWTGAKERGLDRQAYYFHQPGHSIQKHLENLFRILGDDPGELKILWDLESLGALSAQLSVAQVFWVDPDVDNPTFVMGGLYGVQGVTIFENVFAQSAVAGVKQALLDELYKMKDGIKAEYGQFPELYSSNGFLNAYYTQSDVDRDCDLDIAHWGVATPTVPYAWAKRGKTWTDWQKKVWKGGGPGIGMQSADVDLQEFNGDEKAFAEWAGTVVVVEPPPPVDTTGHLMINPEKCAFLNGRSTPLYLIDGSNLFITIKAGCYVKDLQESRESGGITWQHVQLDQYDFWMSKAFLV